MYNLHSRVYVCVRVRVCVYVYIRVPENNRRKTYRGGRMGGEEREGQYGKYFPIKTLKEARRFPFNDLRS